MMSFQHFLDKGGMDLTKESHTITVSKYKLHKLEPPLSTITVVFKEAPFWD